MIPSLCLSLGEPTFRGLAAPGAEVIVIASSRASSGEVVLGRTVADPDGIWTVTSRSLPNGAYRVQAKGIAIANPTGPRLRVLPKARLGTITVDAPYSG